MSDPEQQESGPEVLHGPWTPSGCDYQLRVVRTDGEIVAEESFEGGWTRATHWALPAELARLAAENADLRDRVENLEIAVGDLDEARADRHMDAVAAEEERDRLRVQVAQLREFASEIRREDAECYCTGPEGACFYCRAAALLADPDGQADAEWLETEKAKAAEPWKALAAELLAAESVSWVVGDEAALPAQALAWLADREAKAREEGWKEAGRRAASRAEEISASLAPASAVNALRDLAAELEGGLR